jgi:hypothetical protein
MNDLAPVIAAVCGFAVVCVGLVLVGGFLLIRLGGKTLLGPVLGNFLGGRGEEEAIEDRPYVSQRASSQATARDLRTLAQSLDFDAAVQKYRQQGGVSAQNTPDPNYTPSPPPANLDDFDPDKYDIRGTYSRQPNTRPARRRADESQDEMLGGLFDSEDDQQ